MNLLNKIVANQFSQLARKSRNNVSSTKVKKEAIENPPLEIFKLGSELN